MMDQVKMFLYGFFARGPRDKQNSFEPKPVEVTSDGALKVSFVNPSSIPASNVSGTLGIANGGTSATNAATARTALGIGLMGTNNSITLTTDVTGVLPLVNGGTGASNAANARTNLGLNTLATNSQVDLASQVTGVLALVNGGTGATNAAGVRSALSLGTLATNSQASLTTQVTGTLPIANGGTGATNAAGALSSLGIGATYGRNALMNCNFNVRQRDWTNPLSAHTKVVDGWMYHRGADEAVNVSKDTDVPDGRSTYSLKVACSTADASIGASQYSMIGQRVEGYNALRFPGQQAALSFWVKSNKTGTYCINIRNGAPDRSYVAEYTINAANTWEFKTITLTFNYSGGTWDFGNGIGLQVSWTLASGSTFHTTANAWQIGNYKATANQVNLMDSNTNYWQISRPQLELGAVPTDFEFIDYGTELWRCQRYYEVFTLGANPPAIAGYYGSAGTHTYGPYQWKAKKRITPSLGVTGVGLSSNNCSRNTSVDDSNIDSFSLGISITAPGSFWISFNGSVVGDAEL